MIHFDEEKQKRSLAELKRADEETLAEMLAQKYGTEYINLARISVNTDALRLIKPEVAKNAVVAAFAILNKKISVAVVSPTRQEVHEVIDNLKYAGYTPIIYTASEEGIKKVWERYADVSYNTETKGGALDISNKEIEGLLEKVKVVADVSTYINEALSMKKSYMVSRVLTIIMAGALALKSSDVHIEAEEESARVRYRLDGVLVDVAQFEKHIYELLLSRIKLLSNLKLNLKDVAQDGRFSIKVFEDDIEIRTSLIPGGYGESVVMRVLNPKSLSVNLEDMGIPANLYKILMEEIARPNGMVLTTGPTGSGKTTTLYSFLKKVLTSEVKIITIEDPIEYHLQGVTQTQTDAKKGYTFAQGLRSILRQDPDVIMVGEIRDNETAEVAINSALTGHLVFSTLHTNNAAGTFTRLMDLKINPKILTSAINIALAQRLVRKICDNCKKKVEMKITDRDMMQKTIDSIVNKEDEQKLLDTGFVYEAVGCDMCNKTGYKGRVGVFEAIRTTDAIEEILRSNPSEREIEKAAAPDGIKTLKQDGVTKVLKGVTTLDELSRVIDLY